MNTLSPQGEEMLVVEEGEVLRAYRCPAGVPTIGVGITSGAGVGKVTMGMTITRAQSRQMLREALKKNYEPRVRKHMPAASQTEFDAGVLFDFNTGAIHRASWVKLWLQKAHARLIRQKFMLWNKGGGKVLPGLVKRREREFRLLTEGVYYASAPAAAKTPSPRTARWALALTPAEQAAALEALRKLGHAVGDNPNAIPAAVIRTFQAEHRLTPDGVIGRATLSTLQRRVDAAAKVKPAAALSVAGAGATGAPAALPASDPAVDAVAGLLAQSGPLLLGLAAVFGVYLLWRYRDVAAVKTQTRFPAISALLRSF